MPDLGKELRAIRKEAEEKGWRVFRKKKYWKMYCPCPRKCKKTVRLTPSDPNYVKNLLGELRRATCWTGRGEPR
ncbi:hypothetical protein [Actinomadura sp. SCN-SB]|uniref:hypothetical protein n=1 Tax=Actinomadura sp. SCN-SB TaxID=3373092 RepID=UPI0037504098